MRALRAVKFPEDIQELWKCPDDRGVFPDDWLPQDPVLGPQTIEGHGQTSPLSLVGYSGEVGVTSPSG